MKRLFVLMVLLSICMTLAIGIQPVAAETNSSTNEDVVLLSSLSEEECRQVLADYGVTIPEQFQDVMFKKMMT